MRQGCPWRRAGVACDVRTTDAVGNPCSPLRLPLCRSAARVEKERAMHERFCKRIEAGLERMARRIAKSKRRLNSGVLERQIGRLLERHARAAARYSICIEEDHTHDSGLRLPGGGHPPERLRAPQTVQM